MKRTTFLRIMGSLIVLAGSCAAYFFVRFQTLLSGSGMEFGSQPSWLFAVFLILALLLGIWLLATGGPRKVR